MKRKGMEKLGDVKLGAQYRDTVSGFEGTATARIEYLNGCVRVSLEKLHEGHDLKELMFDIQRLAEVGSTKAHEPVRRTGGARPTPPRTGAM